MDCHDSDYFYDYCITLFIYVFIYIYVKQSEEPCRNSPLKNKVEFEGSL